MPLPELALGEVLKPTDSGGEVALSPWAESAAKRIFDVSAVVLCAPIVAPLLLVVALAVLVACGRPILFRQVRIGHSGRPFSILKFRTMLAMKPEAQSAIAAMSADHITPLGRILRRAKLDELPQLYNVLAGDMSLVGPRPRVADQQTEILCCRPGITGSATLIFAREEAMLQSIGRETVPQYYRTAILPAKTQLDADYIRHATFLSDLGILLKTILGNW